MCHFADLKELREHKGTEKFIAIFEAKIDLRMAHTKGFPLYESLMNRYGRTKVTSLKTG